MELQRAGRALEDLAAAPAGGRPESSRQLIDVTELVESYAPAWSALASGYGADLYLDPADRVAGIVFADPLRIAQACANLIGNAAEHGGGSVRVCVRAGSGHVRIEITDDGPGLPMSVSALTATAGARRGRRGHGLAIAAAIAEHHGGQLRAAPAEGGARLVLEMPAAKQPVVA